MIPTLANAAWATANLPQAFAFNNALKDPQRAQASTLRHYLRTNAHTAFGREHRFEDIQSTAEFQSRVPVRTYDEFIPWIERIAAGEQRVLTTERVTRFAPSSGSTAAAKLIPYTRTLQREFSRAVSPWITDLYRDNPQLVAGPAYWSVSPSLKVPYRPDSAIPVGLEDDSEYLGGIVRHLVDAVMAVPGAVRHIQSIDDFRYITLLYLLRCRNLRLVSVWNPSFLSVLINALPACWLELIKDIRKGGCSRQSSGPWRCLRPDVARADELESGDPADPSSLWPALQLISCWTDSHAQLPAAALAAQFRGAAMQPKGLLATEGVVSIPYSGVHPLAIRSHFFEFIDDTGRPRLAHELQKGGTYSVLLTTAGGLYRYNLNDQVVVDGMIGSTPSIRFLGKGDSACDLVGEKLSDGFVHHCLMEFVRSLPTAPPFAMLAPGSSPGQPHYVLFVEHRCAWPGDPEAILDALLRRNPHYRYARELGQLGPPRLFLIHQDAYSQFCARLASRGQKLGDIKPCSLSRLTDWADFFEGSYYAAASVAPKK